VIDLQFHLIKKRFNYAAVKASAVALYQSFCHFLALMQESNQRKSRKNNASTRKKSTRTPLFFPPHAHGMFVF
jgi:ABC-type Fe3+ transport system permease subunit